MLWLNNLKQTFISNLIRAKQNDCRFQAAMLAVRKDLLHLLNNKQRSVCKQDYMKTRLERLLPYTEQTRKKSMNKFVITNMKLKLISCRSTYTRCFYMQLNKKMW